MGNFLEWIIFGFLRYLLSLGIAVFLLFPSIRFVLVQAFERLPRRGIARTLRQLLAFPVIGLLSRERRTLRGDRRSLFQLFLCQLAGAFIISLAIQGILATSVYTLASIYLAHRIAGSR